MKTRTVGISPKLIAAVITAVLTYLLGQEVLELPAWATVTGQGVLVALAVYAASPGTVARETDPDARRPGIPSERGYSIFEVLAALFVALLIVIVLLALLDRL